MDRVQFVSRFSAMSAPPAERVHASSAGASSGGLQHAAVPSERGWSELWPLRTATRGTPEQRECQSGFTAD
jgi:hypothetical protein